MDENPENSDTPAEPPDAEMANESPSKLGKWHVFGMLTKFMLPLVITQIVPDIADQVKLYQHTTS